MDQESRGDVESLESKFQKAKFLEDEFECHQHISTSIKIQQQSISYSHSDPETRLTNSRSKFSILYKRTTPLNIVRDKSKSRCASECLSHKNLVTNIKKKLNKKKRPKRIMKDRQKRNI